MIISESDYIYAQVTTPLMRYVDDIEFVFNPTLALIDVRSSSRIGYYDFEINRKRIENIRAEFTLPLD